jgi:hypothetical protein
LDAEQRDYAVTIRESATALLAIVNDVLDFSKIEAGKVDLDLSAFDIRALIAGMVKAFEVRARQKGIALGWTVGGDVPATLIGDPRRLQQILVNLIGNAIKFTEQGAIDVRVETEEAADGVTLRCAVRDSGIGVPADQRERIFTAFEQVDSSTTRRFGGTGLGLAITAKLVALMGGRIWVDSAPGLGSTFSFTARTRKAAEHDTGAGVAAADETAAGRQPSGSALDAVPPAEAVDSRLRILLVEDNAVNRQVATRLLEKRGHQVTTAENGKQAVAAFTDGGLDVILMDVQMPEMDGLEATVEIRRREAGSGGRIPIVALTAHALNGDAERCLAAGMDAYVSKPIRANLLLEAIRGAVERRPVPAPHEAAAAPAA